MQQTGGCEVMSRNISVIEKKDVGAKEKKEGDGDAPEAKASAEHKGCRATYRDTCVEKGAPMLHSAIICWPPQSEAGNDSMRKIPTA